MGVPKFPWLVKMEFNPGLIPTMYIYGLQSGYSFDKSASYDSQSILNRSSPVVNYSGSNSGNFSLDIQVHATQSIYQEVINPIRYFYATQFPVVPGRKPPPICKLSLGEEMNYLLPTRPWMCVITSCNISVSGPWVSYSSYGNRPGGAPMEATISLSFLEIDIKPLSCEDTLKGISGGGMGGTGSAPNFIPYG